MTEEKYTAEQLEQMADQLLQETAPAQDKPAKGGLDEKTIASLPAAALLNGNEKLRDLFTKGKKKGKLDACWTSWTWRASRWTPSTTLWSSWASR